MYANPLATPHPKGGLQNPILHAFLFLQMLLLCPMQDMGLEVDQFTSMIFAALELRQASQIAPTTVTRQTVCTLKMPV